MKLFVAFSQAALLHGISTAERPVDLVPWYSSQCGAQVHLKTSMRSSIEIYAYEKEVDNHRPGRFHYG